MAVTTRDLYLSKNSVVYSYLAQAPTESIGVKNPISLPKVDYETIAETIGDKFAKGQSSTIYHVNVKESIPRVYKVISKSNFQDGNEIRISKVASVLRITPTFYSAFIVEDQNDLSCFINIEMEASGKSLGKWMEDLAENSEIDEEKEEDSKPARQLSEKEKALQEMQKILFAKIEKTHSHEFATEIQPDKEKKLSIDEAIDKLYPNRETFYYELINKIKILAENCIAYPESHVGNILPNHGTSKGLQLIDFDSAQIMSDIKAAAKKALNSIYNVEHLRKFKALPNLSAKSIELLNWCKQYE